MADTSRPPMASRQQAYSVGEAMSDADPVQQQVVALGNGVLAHYPPAGSMADQLGLPRVPLTTATSSGTAATRDAQAYGSFGAAPEGPAEQTHVGVPQP